MEGFWENGSFVLRSTIEARAARKDNEITALRQELEAVKAELDDVKQVQFPRKCEAIKQGWEKKLATVTAEVDQWKATAALGLEYQKDLQAEHRQQLSTATRQLDIAVKALEKVALELGIDGLLKEWLFVDEALAAIQQINGEAQHLG